MVNTPGSSRASSGLGLGTPGRREGADSCFINCLEQHLAPSRRGNGELAEGPLGSLGSGSPVPHSHSHGLPPPAPNGLPESAATPGTSWNLPAWDHRRDSAIRALMSHLGDRAEPRVPRGGKPWRSTFQIIPFSHTPTSSPSRDSVTTQESGREGWEEAENHS